MVLVDEPFRTSRRRSAVPGHGLRVQLGIRRLKAEVPMRSRPIALLGIRAEDTLEMTPTEDEDVIQALSSDGTDPALREGVRPRGPNGCLHNAEAFRPEDLVKGS
jgi:hypothetical protein